MPKTLFVGHESYKEYRKLILEIQIDSKWNTESAGKGEIGTSRWTLPI